ncbi:hypothetical protein Y900_021835 [Mycolicibacterium aromaticivorans JS19b1 = JCM 16368]|uniref:Uncharacterized protein n=1 Tax=Mycolicibacterium aromaticivorans JS19b1 = JCM 16368 TaxID=1440774 RepID=A0A064CRP2_9MYCO|nr:hypothetical protein [Mycolicibacterium aromaticivorans]KDF01498.1 hypothetical protein Y900_021835 [Mycolicibacterium aromaticivorans JS19b1 = JCM 16368]
MFAPAAAHRVAAFASRPQFGSGSRSAEPAQRPPASASSAGIVEIGEHQDETPRSAQLNASRFGNSGDTPKRSEATRAVSGDMFTITHEYH